MDNPPLKLLLTERAYHAILAQTFDFGLTNPLPVLRYNKQTHEYEISAYSSRDVEKLQSVHYQNSHTFIYQVGRINICIEDPELVSLLTGKIFDYWDGKFLLKEPEILDESTTNRKPLF